MTDAEKHLWREIRAHRLAGLGFRRQHPVGPYILDFVCLSGWLVVEVGGGQHYAPAGMAHDGRRDAYLRSQGFRVLRFSNLDVLGNLQGVLETILEAVARDHCNATGLIPGAGEGGEGDGTGRAVSPDDVTDREP